MGGMVATSSGTPASSGGSGILPGAAAVAPTTIVDRFNRANNAASLGTTETGETWTARVGTWGITSDQAYVASGAASTRQIATIDTGWADGSIHLAVDVSSTSTTHAGITFRYVDADNYWRFIVNDVNDVCYLQKTVAGVSTIVNGGGAGQSLTVGSAFVLRLVLSGSSILGYINGVLIVNETDAALVDATSHGLHTQWGTGTTGSAIRFGSIAMVPDGGTIDVTYGIENTTVVYDLDASRTDLIVNDVSNGASAVEDVTGTVTLSQGTAADRPATGTRTRNGLNVLDFNGDYMSGPLIAPAGNFSRVLGYTFDSNKIHIVSILDDPVDPDSCSWVAQWSGSAMYIEPAVRNNADLAQNSTAKDFRTTGVYPLVNQAVCSMHDHDGDHASHNVLYRTATASVAATVVATPSGYTDNLGSFTIDGTLRLGWDGAEAYDFDGAIYEDVWLSDFDTADRDMVAELMRLKWALV